MKCIYAIINLVNGKKYIGSTSNFARRKQKHLSELKRNKHHSEHLQLSYNKHGKDNFVFVILQKLSSEEDMRKVEQLYLDKYQTYDNKIGYNMSTSSGFPKECNPEVRNVYQYSFNGDLVKIHKNCTIAAEEIGCAGGGISGCCRGEYRYYMGFVWLYKEDVNQENLEQRLFLANNKPRVSDETRAKMREKKLGKAQSIEAREKHSALLKGKTPSNLSAIQQLRRVSVYVYDKDHNFIEEFESVSECNKKYPTVRQGLSKPFKKPKQFYFYREKLKQE